MYFMRVRVYVCVCVCAPVLVNVSVSQPVCLSVYLSVLARAGKSMLSRWYARMKNDSNEKQLDYQ